MIALQTTATLSSCKSSSIGSSISPFQESRCNFVCVFVFYYVVECVIVNYHVFLSVGMCMHRWTLMCDCERFSACLLLNLPSLSPLSLNLACGRVPQPVCLSPPSLFTFALLFYANTLFEDLGNISLGVSVRRRTKTLRVVRSETLRSS